MKILNVVSGIGYGDATREYANIIALKKRFPRVRIMIAGYDNSYRYFKDKYPTIKIRGYKLPGSKMKVKALSFGFRNLLLPARWLLSTLKVPLYASKFIPDLIISDFEPVGISLAKVLQKPCLIVFGFDPRLYQEYARKHKVNYKMLVEAKYFEKLYHQADVVIIPTFKKYKGAHPLFKYVNPIVRQKPGELPSESKICKQLKLKKRPLVVMLGGSELGTKLARNLNLLAPQFKNEEFIIFGSNLNINTAKNVKYIRYTENFLKYLKVSKGVITLAGQETLSEALSYRKPILCFPIQDHIEQVLNAYALQETAFVSHDSSLKTLYQQLSQFIQQLPVWKRRVEQYDLKANGADQVADIIESFIKKKHQHLV